MKKSQCTCLKPPFHFNDFKSLPLGVDESNGTFAEVSVDTCLKCQSLWLNYSFEIEGFSHSGRWFRGIINTEQLGEIRPQNALICLNSLEWHFFGGSYFSSDGMKSTSTVQI